MAEKDEIQKRIKEEIARLDKASAKAYQEKLKGLDAINTSLDTYQSLLNDIKNKVADIDKGFSGILSEIKAIVGELEKGNKNTRDATKAFKGLESIASKLKYDQQGYNDLNLDQLQTEKRKLGVLENQARAAAKQLAREKGIVSLAHTNLAFRRDLSEEERAILTAAKEGFTVYERTNQLLKERIKEEKKLERRLGATGAILAGMGKIPIVGPLLKTNEALDAAREKAKAGGNSFQVMGAAAKSIGSNLLSSLADPLVSIGLLVKAFQLFIKLGLAADKQIVDLQKSMVVSRSEAESVRDRFMEITRESSKSADEGERLLVTQKNLVEAQLELANAFGATRGFTERQLKDQILLTKQMKFTAEEAAGIQQLAMANGLTADQTTAAILKQTVALSKQTGIQLDNKKIIGEVAKISGQLRLQYGNNVKQLAAAVIQSNKLGFSLEKTKQIAEQLLNFEESIENELSAELLIGRDLNLEQARLLALNGKSAEAVALMAQQMGGSAEFSKLNVIQQESLAKALGMSADELANSMIHQENLNKLGSKTKQQILERVDALKAAGKTEEANALMAATNSEKDAQNALKSLDAQDKFNAAIEKLQALLGTIVEGPAAKFVDMLGGLASDSDKLLSVFKSIGAVIASFSLAKMIGQLLIASSIQAILAAGAITWASGITLGIGIAAVLGGIAIGMASLTNAIDTAKSASTTSKGANFATGGVVMSRIDNATIGERGPEAIIPLSSPSAKQMMGGGGPTQLTANLILDGQVLATMVAQVDRTDPNRVGTERQINNRDIQ
jgi:hypothetical protein